MAAFAFNVSKIVSIMMKSTAPSTRPIAASAYVSTSSRKLMLRAEGSSTSGERLADRVVGPRIPATNRGLLLVEASSAAFRAIRADW